MRLFGGAMLVVLCAGCGESRSAGSPRSTAEDASAGDSVMFEGGFFGSPIPARSDAGFEPEPTTFRFELPRFEDAAAQCIWGIPEAPPGEILDVDRVRLVVVHDGGTELLYEIASAAECDQAGAWYFDDPANPTQVILCPATCEAVEGTVALDVLPGPTPTPPFK